MDTITVLGFRCSMSRQAGNRTLAVTLGNATSVQQLEAIVANNHDKYRVTLLLSYLDRYGNVIYSPEEAGRLLTNGPNPTGIGAARDIREYFAVNFTE